MQRHERIEHKEAADRGGKRVSNSGRSWHSKGDVEAGPFLIDTKDAIDAKSFSLNFKKVEKHFHDAMKAGKTGLIVVYFQDSIGRTRKLSVVEDYVLDPLYEADKSE